MLDVVGERVVRGGLESGESVDWELREEEKTFIEQDFGRHCI